MAVLLVMLLMLLQFVLLLFSLPERVLPIMALSPSLSLPSFVCPSAQMRCLPFPGACGWRWATAVTLLPLLPLSLMLAVLLLLVMLLLALLPLASHGAGSLQPLSSPGAQVTPVAPPAAVAGLPLLSSTSVVASSGKTRCACSLTSRSALAGGV